MLIDPPVPPLVVDKTPVTSVNTLTLDKLIVDPFDLNTVSEVSAPTRLISALAPSVAPVPPFATGTTPLTPMLTVPVPSTLKPLPTVIIPGEVVLAVLRLNIAPGNNVYPVLPVPSLNPPTFDVVAIGTISVFAVNVVHID